MAKLTKLTVEDKKGILHLSTQRYTLNEIARIYNTTEEKILKVRKEYGTS